MFTLRRSIAAAVILVAALAGASARADLPPPDGMTRTQSATATTAALVIEAPVVDAGEPGDAAREPRGAEDRGLLARADRCGCVVDRPAGAAHASSAVDRRSLRSGRLA